MNFEFKIELSLCLLLGTILAKNCISTNTINIGTRAVPSLKFLIVVSKHGARAPTHTYPRDPYKDKSLWPDGPGHITGVGKRQMYNVGQKLRRLYDGFLINLYLSNDVMAQSTLVDRTMISAATLLAGLYPPQKHHLWNPDILWHPVPIYPNLLDKSLLTIDPRHCPRYWQEQNASSAAQPVHDSQHEDIYEAMSKGSGRNLTTCSNMYLLYHNFAAMLDNGLPLPEWAEAIFHSRMLPTVSKMVHDSTIKNVKMVKILNGLFLSKIHELLRRHTRSPQSAKEQQDELSLFLHVGHDITLLCLLAALSFTDVNIPPASTTLIFELHSNSELPSKHQVQVLKIDGKTNNTDILQLLDLPACPSPCDLDAFLAYSKKYTITDFRRECYDMTSPSDS